MASKKARIPSAPCGLGERACRVVVDDVGREDLVNHVQPMLGLNVFDPASHDILVL